MPGRLLIIGLDGAEPSLVFGRLRERMPMLSRLAGAGSWGHLRSTVPPVTIPAWTSMFTGLDPGQLGLYGFRNRIDHGYGDLAIATSGSVEAPRVWDRLGEAGLTSYLIGIPGTYPPWPVRGRMVSGFLAPSTCSPYTYPADLKHQVDEVTGGYVLDVDGFRTEEPGRLLARIRDMTEKRFRLARAWAGEPEWDLLVMVEMGLDRMHHGFWRFFDPDHRLHLAGSPFADAIPDYLAFLDDQVATLVEAAGPAVTVMVVSDHGARPMEGGFRLNEWLIEQGDLVLRAAPGEPQPLSPDMVDWGRTRAWGEGGYHGRVFLNVAGREHEGTLPAAEREAYRDDLARRFEATADEDGKPLGTRVFVPERTYRSVRGIPPDLVVHFGDLAWRSIAEVGTGRVHARGEIRGADDANHAEDGVFICSDPLGGPPGERLDRSIIDVAGLVLRILEAGS